MSANHSSKLEAKFRYALELHQQGKRQQAGKLYRTILKSQPEHPGALHYMGVLAHQEGNQETAVRLISSAIQRQPGYFDAVMNLGNVFQEQERFAEAAEYYQRAIALRPAEAAAYSNLSVSLRRLDRLEDAFKISSQAVELDPQSLVAWYTLGNACKEAQKYPQAIAAYQQAIKLKPDFSLAHDGLCQSTYQLEYRTQPGRRTFSKTIQAYEQWQACEPQNALASFMLQAIRGEQKLTRAPDEVVRKIFDQFAPSFEQHLQSLEYKLPQQLNDWLPELLGPPKASLNILDGGCGTGLGAAALKPWARRLTGVDISSGMLEKALHKGLYDELVESELTGFLQHRKAEFDLVLFADTLIYFGELEEILRATCAALREGGAVLFTLEASSPDKHGQRFTLHPTGRYSHSKSYIEALMPACGFQQLSISQDSTRKEIGKPVPGLVVSARKI